MILLCGIPTETALARVAAELKESVVPFQFFNQRAFADTDFSFGFAVEGIKGTLRLGRESYRIEDVGGVYARLMDDRFLPELKGEADSSPMRNRCRKLHDTLLDWLEISQARIINRVSAMASNGSKPYQSQLVRAVGFAVPETLVTNQPDLVLEFFARHQRVIYKSTSGVRSIVRELTVGDLDRLDDIRWCPVQFQAYVEGVDVRVHVIGSEVYATRITSGASDYRYAGSNGGTPATLEAISLSDEFERRSIELTAKLGLSFSGIDLRITPSGEAVCFEVNPCPAYTYFEGHTGQPIARSVAQYLAGAHT